MMYMENCYLIKLQFLGFRFSGWQKQSNAKTIQEMVERTFSFLFKHSKFKILGAGRTDAKVSAEAFLFQVFTNENLNSDFLSAFNKSLPPDIRAIDLQNSDASLNLIGCEKSKMYRYLFSYGDEKPHPFSSALMVHIDGDLDLELMQDAAKLFIGTHNFRNFCYKPNDQTEVSRTIDCSSIKSNTNYTASFFPKKSFVFEVEAKGFLRHQIRMMMAGLFEVGKKNLSLEDLRLSLTGEGELDILIAPSSGLILAETNIL